MKIEHKYCWIFLGLLIAGSIVPQLARSAASGGKYFDYVVTILMENNDLQSVLAQGHFQAGLANNYSLSMGYSAVSHPSEPNYSSMVSGQIGVNSNDGVCCGQDNHQNLVDSLESHGLSWKAYAEGQTTGDCTGANIDTNHFPFLYFQDIVSRTSRCNNLMGTTASTDQEFVDSLNAQNGWPNWLWLTPNTSNDAHSSSIAYGDNYLSGLVPKILSSALFQTQRTALFIVYDEGNDVACSSGGSDCVYASWSGPVAKRAFSSTSTYTHYSYLHTIEDNWGLGTLGQDANTPPMSEFFSGVSNSPTSILSMVEILIIIAVAGLVGVLAIITTKRRGRQTANKTN